METDKKINKRKKGITTQHSILVASARMFAEKGYDNVSVREIAHEVGVKESSIYNHYKNKQDILDKLYQEFAVRAPLSRPSYEELKLMSQIMSLQEILKNIMFSVGRNIDDILSYVSVIIQCERFRSRLGAEAYYNYLVNEPAAYYQYLIEVYMGQKKVEKSNSLDIIQQYCYTAMCLSQEYFMATNGYGDVDEVVRRMLKTIDFFCSLITDTNNGAEN